MPNIYQFKISLNGIKPKIWRRILVPQDYTFKQFHKAIHCCMGWSSIHGNYHLHEFRMKNPSTSEMNTIGVADDNELDLDPFGLPKTISEIVIKVADYFPCVGKKGEYEYDFGDGWQHEVLLEMVLPRVPGKVYPVCTAGKNACPPEDCGGISGYAELLEVLADPNHEEHRETKKWMCALGYPAVFDSSAFNPHDVYFF